MKITATRLILATSLSLLIMACAKEKDSEKAGHFPQLNPSALEGNYVSNDAERAVILRIKDGRISMASKTRSEYRCKDDRPYELVDGHILRLAQSEHCSAVDLTIVKDGSSFIYFADIAGAGLPMRRVYSGEIESAISAFYGSDDLLSASLQDFQVNFWSAGEAEAYIEEAKAYLDRFHLRVATPKMLAIEVIGTIQNGKIVYPNNPEESYCIFTSVEGLSEYSAPHTVPLSKVSGQLFVDDNRHWEYRKGTGGDSQTAVTYTKSEIPGSRLVLTTEDITLICYQSPSKGPVRMENIRAILGDLITIEEI